MIAIHYLSSHGHDVVVAHARPCPACALFSPSQNYDGNHFFVIFRVNINGYERAWCCLIYNLSNTLIRPQGLNRETLPFFSVNVIHGHDVPLL